LFTKWLDKSVKPLVFDFGRKVTVDGYRWATGFDAPGRDPVEWEMHVSRDGKDGPWTLLHKESLDLTGVESPRNEWAEKLNTKGVVKCSKGKYINGENAPASTRCLNCLPGLYQKREEQASCAKCPPGKYTKHITSVACSVCPQGKYAKRESANKCTACPDGKFQKSEGAKSCQILAKTLADLDEL